jgi:hypothetical protein
VTGFWPKKIDNRLIEAANASFTIVVYSSDDGVLDGLDKFFGVIVRANSHAFDANTVDNHNI